MSLHKKLCIFSGDDYNIICQSDGLTQKRFRAIGMFVSVIFLMSFLSCSFTFTKLFRSYLISIPIGLFFSFMITNIYLFLLYTLSKNSFPRQDSPTGKFSIVFRITFICFIAIIVSKPIETILYASKLDRDIDLFRHDQITEYTNLTNAHYNHETKNIRMLMAKQKQLGSGQGNERISYYEQLLRKKDMQKSQLITAMEQLVSDSNYYIRSISIMNSSYKSCWLLTFLVISIFLLPAGLKYLLNHEDGSYYQLKKTIETKIVIDEYSIFKKRYYHLNKGTPFSEPYADPPFNTIRKTDERDFLEEDDLINDLYHA